MPALRRIANAIDAVNKLVGEVVSWLSLVLVLVIVIDVSLRYIFNWSSAISFEIEWHIFAVLFMLSAGWALREDKHVRVDVFYQRFSKKNQSATNLVGTLFLLIPFCAVGFWESLPFVASSYEMMEKSTDAGGLPARFLIKSVIPLGFFLLGIQGVSLAIQSSFNLLNKA